MHSKFIKSAGSGGWLSKTDEWLQLLVESFARTSPKSSYKITILDRSPLVGRSAATTKSWLATLSSFLSRHEILLLLFLRLRKEGADSSARDVCETGLKITGLVEKVTRYLSTI